jgi:hypothetical protein
MKKLKLFTCILFIILLINACSKDDCPKGIKYTFEYYNISENIKKTFPYQFKDTQVWINVNTNDTLHYILKDTVSSYDTTLVSPTDGCVENNYTYTGRFTYKFNCLEDSSYNYLYTYRYSNGLGLDPYLKFNKIQYYTYIKTYDSIINYSKTYTKVRDRKFFWENYEIGILRITINNIKLYRIK